MSIEEYRNKKKNNEVEINSKLKRKIKSFINKVLISIIILLIGLIINKRNPSFSKKINKKLFEENINFIKLKKTYNKYFGKYIGETKQVEDVFTEKMNYKSKSIYKDGVKLEVESGYLIPAIESGIVVYEGEKEGYGYTVIVEQINGINVWYSNINPKDIKMYDYINKGDLIGEAKDKKIYLLFEQKGKFLDYKKYI
ncbi:MAG: M23 family metallopeptidase [Bacilli bacterium]|nr:M23 family metallopeptidase [Bacilli bacterium]